MIGTCFPLPTKKVFPLPSPKRGGLGRGGKGARGLGPVFESTAEPL